jgi:hypothetical protein
MEDFHVHCLQIGRVGYQNGDFQLSKIRIENALDILPVKYRQLTQMSYNLLTRSSGITAIWAILKDPYMLHSLEGRARAVAAGHDWD